MLANDLITLSADKQFVTKTMHLPANYIESFHSHSWHQIIFPLNGLLQTNIDNKNFVVPHNGLLFVPANTVHRSIAISNSKFLALYLNPSFTVNDREKLKSCLVSSFLKELIVLLFNVNSTTYDEQMITNLLQVLHNQIELAGNYDIPILIPDDRRLKSIFKRLTNQPDLQLTLADWAVTVGASQRTLTRICAKEFNQSFSLWRQSIRLVFSLELLAKKMSILEVALHLGYKSDAAYIYAFKRLFQQTPSKYRKNHLS